MMIPPKNAIDAFILCFWKKKRNVRSKPITHAKPAMNRICRKTHKSYYILYHNRFHTLHLHSLRQVNFYQTITACLRIRKIFQSLLGQHQFLKIKIPLQYYYLIKCNESLLCVSLISNIFVYFVNLFSSKFT